MGTRQPGTGRLTSGDAYPINTNCTLSPTKRLEDSGFSLEFNRFCMWLCVPIESMARTHELRFAA